MTAGVQLTAGRLRLVRELRPFVAACYSAVSGTERDTELRYWMSVSAAGDRGPDDEGNAASPEVAEDMEPDPEKLAIMFREALAVRGRAEFERAVCLVGPHRDELELRIGGMPARGVHLTRLSLTDFRSYRKANVTLGPGVTTFQGSNGQGKTNLVEADVVRRQDPLARAKPTRARLKAVVD